MGVTHSQTWAKPLLGTLLRTTEVWSPATAIKGDDLCYQNGVTYVCAVGTSI